MPLPPRFRYPQDARRQLAMAREYIAAAFRRRAGGPVAFGRVGLRRSLPDRVAKLGFEWAATDSGVLNRTLSRHGRTSDGLYRPYQLAAGRARHLGVIFRDHFLSDLIGFVYSKMDAGAAAADFLRRIRENCAGILAAGRDALVPIILDGENAWEYYDRNGRPFLRELYRAHFARTRQMRAVTVSEALAAAGAGAPRPHFPGLVDQRQFRCVDRRRGRQPGVDAIAARARDLRRRRRRFREQQRELAFEELLIAEGSDWCWWYGPEHDSANRAEFDQLYRSHLANVYRFLNLMPPEELSRPDSAHRGAGRADSALRRDLAHHRRRSHFLLRMDGRGHLSRG